MTPREEYEAVTGQRKRAPAIPRELRDIVIESRAERLVVRGLDGQSIPVSLEWFEPTDFATYQDERFFGFRFIGYEEDGYVLVDRRARGGAAIVATGQAPVFSPDGRYFAAAEMSDSGWGNLNGVALWEVLPDGTMRRFFTDVLPRTEDWRVDRWVRPDCVAVSAMRSDYQIPDTSDRPQAVRNAPRENYAIRVGQGVAMTATYEQAACVPQETP
jgi:hypothetical protein